jgi:hypothetical protein
MTTPSKPLPEDQPQLERLLERIECGTIEDAEALDPRDLELLRRYYGNEEDLQSLLDRLRGSSREEG